MIFKPHPDRNPLPVGGSKIPKKNRVNPYFKYLPWLVYHETSLETMYTADALVKAGLVNPDQCCILIDKPIEKVAFGIRSYASKNNSNFP